MVTKVTLPGQETIDFNLRLENQAKYFYRFETWTPIMGALLLSGIFPTDYWNTSLKPPGNSTMFPQRDQFDELMKRIPERDRRGLDGGILTASSDRFHQARKVLREWDKKCEDDEKYPFDLAPWEFVAWLEEICHGEEIRFIDQRWLAAFLKLHGIESKNQILPANVMKSFQKVTNIGDDGGRHPLGAEIIRAQQQAKSNCTDPYDIDVIFPLISHILEERGAIDKSNEKYVPGKRLPLELDDGRHYHLVRDSLRVHLNRLKEKYFRQPQ